MATPTSDRIHRLTGDDGIGGGLPLPPIFSSVANHLLDNGPSSFEALTAMLEMSMESKSNRIMALYPESGYEGLTRDVLNQLEDMKIVSESDGQWMLVSDVPMGKPIKVIPNGSKSKSHYITLYSADERQQISLGDTEKRELQAAYTSIRSRNSFSVQVQTQGGTPTRHFQLHEFATAFSQIPEKEFMEMASSVKAIGFTDPVITLYEGRVLDGSHRTAIASALNIPIKTINFPGDRQSAIQYVRARNDHRRHETPAQRALSVQRLELPEAERQAKERQQQGQENGRVARYQESGLASIEAKPDEPKSKAKASEEAVRMSGGRTSRASLERIEPVREAPQTQAKIDSGQIKSVSEARREALVETGRIEAVKHKPIPDKHTLRVCTRECVREAAEHVLRHLEEDNYGNVTDTEFDGRIQEFESLIQSWKRAHEKNKAGR